MAFSQLPPPPYYAVIFCSTRPDFGGSDDGYAETAEQMAALAATMPGYLGQESVRGADGFGITVSYWQDEAAIAHWKANMDHKAARDSGRTRWYEHYELRVAKVERAYGKPASSK